MKRTSTDVETAGVKARTLARPTRCRGSNIGYRDAERQGRPATYRRLDWRDVVGPSVAARSSGSALTHARLTNAR
jgi:hypothetical protein